MVPPMDMSRGSPGKIMVSPPRLNLRRATSYQNEKNVNDRAPLSATSARFSFNHLLLSSPPPSPGLPAPIQRPRKTSAAPRPSKVLRTVAWVAALVAFLYVASAILQHQLDVPIVSWGLDRAEYEMVGQYDLPDFPTPIAITDSNGKSKWTVSIPPTYAFPLAVDEYADICAKCHEVAVHVRELHGRDTVDHSLMDYYYRDPYFVDISEAERMGMLPGIDGHASKVAARAQNGHLVGDEDDGLVEKETCQSSLTFVLESPEAGLGTTLMMLWTAYGLAQKEDRAFFIDDSRWAYGDYTEIFAAPPVPECSPPPRHEMLPCPHTARHLVASAATAQDTFGASFSAHFENAHQANNIEQERPVYELARAGYNALFRLNADDAPYVEGRIKELKDQVKSSDKEHANGTVVGVHVRHGDVHPYEYQYNGAYVPLSAFSDKAWAILDELHNNTLPSGEQDHSARDRSLVVVASDDPTVYEAEEFSEAERAQDRIQLASKPEEDPPKSRRAMRKFVDDSFGWEGGFFSSMFWNLGRASINKAHAADLPQTELGPSSETIRLRGLIGRAYAIDLAILGQGSDAVICTTSAMGCRILAVMMGWEQSMVNEKWINLDGDFSWTGVTMLQ